MRRSATRVLDLLTEHSEGLTRAEVMAHTRLSKPTVQAVVNELRASGQISLASTSNGNGATHAGGRPAERFVITRQAGLVLGVDIGHGHIRVAIADRAGNIVGQTEQRVDLDVDRVGFGALGTVVQLTSSALRSSGAASSTVGALVMGIPAALDRNGQVIFSESLPSWAHADLGSEIHALLAREFPQMRLSRDDIRVENDANLGALGAAANGGVAAAAQNYLYVKASTGIGMGIVARGRLYRGADGAAGEFGHMTASAGAAPFVRQLVDPPALPCTRCSKIDCLENMASGQALLRKFVGRGVEFTDDSLTNLLALARSASAAAQAEYRQAVVDAGTLIAHNLSDVIRVLAPELVVVGGLLAQTGLIQRPITDTIAGMRGLPPVEIRFVSKEDVCSIELRGALTKAARLAAARG